MPADSGRDTDAMPRWVPFAQGVSCIAAASGISNDEAAEQLELAIHAGEVRAILQSEDAIIEHDDLGLFRRRSNIDVNASTVVVQLALDEVCRSPGDVPYVPGVTHVQTTFTVRVSARDVTTHFGAGCTHPPSAHGKLLIAKPGVRTNVAARAESDCGEWIKQLAEREKPGTKGEVQTEAKKRWPQLRDRAFERAWALNAPKGWRTGGRPRKTSH